MQQEIEEELERDEEAIWQIIPLNCHFALHYAIRVEGASLCRSCSLPKSE